jgi:hypothetical protein
MDQGHQLELTLTVTAEMIDAAIKLRQRRRTWKAIGRMLNAPWYALRRAALRKTARDKVDLPRWCKKGVSYEKGARHIMRVWHRGFYYYLPECERCGYPLWPEDLYRINKNTGRRRHKACPV